MLVKAHAACRRKESEKTEPSDPSDARYMATCCAVIVMNIDYCREVEKNSFVTECVMNRELMYVHTVLCTEVYSAHQTIFAAQKYNHCYANAIMLRIVGVELNMLRRRRFK
jgi:hypothetical protein